MTEQQAPDPHQQPEDSGYEPASPGMPRWVPLLIGGVLVALAALAVYTGIRYRETGTMAEHVQPRRTSTAATNAPSGEPGAGGSLIMQDQTPNANAPVTGQSRAVISGGPGGVSTTVRIWARRGMMLDVQPAESMVYVNETLIGHANQFDTDEEIYDFAAPGSYNVKIVAPDGATKTYVVTAADEAEQDVATIEANLASAQ